MTDECIKTACAFCKVDDNRNIFSCSLGLSSTDWNPSTCTNSFGLDLLNKQHDTDPHDADPHDAVNSPSHYIGKIEVIDYLRDKLTPAEFTGFCIGNVLKYTSRWRKKDGVQDLKKAKVYLEWAIENEDKKQD